MKTYKEFLVETKQNKPEETELDEARYPTWRVHFKGGPTPVVDARNAAEAIKKAEAIAKKQKPNHSLERTRKGVEKIKEDVEHLDELKKSTLSKYAQKAFVQHNNRFGVAAVGQVHGQEEHPDDARVRRNRKKGLKRAISKMGDDKYGKRKGKKLKEGWGAAKQKRDQEAMKKEHDKYRSKIGPEEKDKYDALIKKGYRGSAAYKKMRGLK